MTEIPKLGIGTWQNTDSETCAKSVQTALDMGYRHIDTAQAYENEQYVGKGINNSAMLREDFFLASKVWISNLQSQDVIETTQESVDKLGVDQVDLMYIHWPSGEYDPVDTFEGMNQIVEEGLTKNIGVSNFTVSQLEEARKLADTGILANQVEMHPLLQQEELVEYCQRNDIYLVAYSPLARGKVFDIPVIQDIAEKHDVSEAQVSLAWLMDKDNVVAIPKASSKEHIRDNFEARDLELDTEDIEKIESIDREERVVDPGFAPW